MALGPPNLASTVSRFSMPAVRRRYGPPTQTDEKLLADGVPTESPVQIHHWPASGETIEQLPEGTEKTNVREGTTTSDIRGPVELTGERADSIVIGAKEYTVVSVGPRNTGSAGTLTAQSLVMTEVQARSWP